MNDSNADSTVQKRPNNNTKCGRSKTKRLVKNLTLKEKIKNNAPDNEFMTNEIVLATIPGFCAWPARIIQIIGETIMVEFFGTGQMYDNEI